MSEQTEARCSRRPLPLRSRGQVRGYLQAEVADLKHMLRQLRAARRGLNTVDVPIEDDE